MCEETLHLHTPPHRPNQHKDNKFKCANHAWEPWELETLSHLIAFYCFFIAYIYSIPSVNIGELCTLYFVLTLVHLALGLWYCTMPYAAGQAGGTYSIHLCKPSPVYTLQPNQHNCDKFKSEMNAWEHGSSGLVSWFISVHLGALCYWAGRAQHTLLHTRGNSPLNSPAKPTQPNQLHGCNECIWTSRIRKTKVIVAYAVTFCIYLLVFPW